MAPPTTLEERRRQQDLHHLLFTAATQQAESSLSHRRALEACQGEREASVAQTPPEADGRRHVPVRERVGPIRDARVILESRRRHRGRDDRREAEHRGGHPRRGGRSAHQQRVEHRTATSLLPLTFVKFTFWFSSKEANCLFLLFISVFPSFFLPLG